MSQERLLTILRRPHMRAEKAVVLNETQNQVVFEVRTDATKSEIKAAVQKLFNVTVDGVNVLNVRGKGTTNRRTNATGKRRNWKKAYVRLAEGSSIDDFIGNE